MGVEASGSDLAFSEGRRNRTCALFVSISITYQYNNLSFQHTYHLYFGFLELFRFHDLRVGIPTAVMWIVVSFDRNQNKRPATTSAT